MVKKVFYFILACLASAFAVAAEPLTDGEIWNEGVEAYRAGDVTNALRVLKPLLLSKSHGARAAEVVAKLEYERGNLEAAANAAQIALRANPKDERANRNFTRAVDGLPSARRTKHIEEVLAASKGQDPGALLKNATESARALLKDAGTYRTNAPARAVELADRYAKRAGILADAWIPVREIIAQSVTNEEQAATIIQQIESAESRTKQAQKELADLDAGAYESMGLVEHDLTRFLKLTALPPLAIAEDLVAQSNAWQDVEETNGRAWQPEALDFTRAFRAKFPAWAKAYEEQAAADTNQPPFTAENQAKVSALATELEKIQMTCVEKHLPPSQEKALELIREIQELLPKGKNSQQNQPDQQQQPNQQQNQNQDQQQQPEQQEQNQDENQQQQAEQQDEEPQEPEEQNAEAKEEQVDADLEAIMKKAQERNDEHEADKRARMRKAKLPPNERDW